MFSLLAVAKVLAVVFALLLFGMMLMPTHTLFLVVGGLSGLVGLVMLFFSPTTGLILIPTGGVMIAIGVGLRKRRQCERAESAKAAEETAHRTSRMMDAYIPSDK
ncbi:MAG: hypothetical protein JSU86_12635 [Phycisphaerales bacterium]|nr:MAG: hypothetical protein JSU86_12635 [Phycisphaerales bacterium]